MNREWKCFWSAFLYGFYFLNGFLPNDNHGAVILTNLGSTPFLQIAMGYVLDIVLELDPVWEKLNQEKWEKNLEDRKKAKEAEAKKEENRVKDTQPSHALGDYAGEYEHPSYGVVPIQFANNELTGKFNSNNFKLVHWHYDIFKGVDAEEGEAGDDGIMITFITIRPTRPKRLTGTSVFLTRKRSSVTTSGAGKPSASTSAG